VLYHLAFVAREVIPVLEEAGSDQEEAAKTLGAMTGKYSGVLPYLILVGVCFMASF